MLTTDMLATMLARRQALPAGTDAADRLAAVAELVRRGAAALKPQARAAGKCLTGLELLEQLAGLEPESVRRLWLALRAADLQRGESVHGDLAADPVAEALIVAAGAAPSLDPNDPAGAVLGRGDAAPKLAARARTVQPRPFTVADATGILFVEPATGLDADALLKAVDQLAARANGSGRARAVLSSRSPQPVDYEIVTEQAPAGAFGETLFESYRPATIRIPGAAPHPTALCESAAMASVRPPAATYRAVLEPELVRKGVLSEIQLETVIYAGNAHAAYLSSDPMDPNGSPVRQGFLIGHGAGVGKGRTIAAIARDNWNQGRRRAVWFSENGRLMADAIRDWTALGGRTDEVFDLRDTPADEPLPQRNGILFATYALLRGTGEQQRRVDQIADWLGYASDAVITFDESQNLRYAVTAADKGWAGRDPKRSLQGMAALRLQSLLPNARFVYASATAASDIATLGYAVRLGLWGKGTAFPTHAAFFEQMEAGGINALELVCRDLKAMGLCLAATLSMDGVAYERLEVQLTDEQRTMQDRFSEIWARVNAGLQRALVTTGLTPGHQHVALLAKNIGKAERAIMRNLFGMAKARFFQALLAAIKTPSLIESARQDLAQGHAVIVQLTNTFAANLERSINAVHGDADQVDATPRDILVKYVKEQFPVQKHQIRHLGRGQSVLQPMVDANGNPVLCPQACAERDQLVAEIAAMPLPEGPLEQLLAAFGPEQVAEITGRQRRLVPSANGGREIQERTPASVVEDVRAFQNDAKRILAFSTAGAAGASYHASRSFANQRLRRHYLLQPGFRADAAVQALGRSHRADQVQPPVYVLTVTDLWSDHRMISTIAAGMQSLGAITRGQRQAASCELFSEEDNLESDLAGDAWVRFLKDLAANRIPNLSLARFEHETGLPLREANGSLRENLPEVRRFLNAMSGMTCARQEAFGLAFKQCLDDVRIEAVRNGSYDRGVETISAESMVKLEDRLLWQDPRSGTPTKLVRLLKRDPVTPVPFQDVLSRVLRGRSAHFARSALTGRVCALVWPAPKHGIPAPDDLVTVITPARTVVRTRQIVQHGRFTMLGIDEAENLWQAEMAAGLPEEEEEFWIITGTLLLLWDKLPKHRPVIYRIETDEGEQLLGRVLSDLFVDRLIRRVDALNGKNAIDPQATIAALHGGEIATLANGWALMPRRNPATGGYSVQIVVPDDEIDAVAGELISDGCRIDTCPRSNAARFWLPDDAQAAIASLKSVAANRPVVGVTSLGLRG